MTDCCKTCRFWLYDQTTNGFEPAPEDGDIAFGQCRRRAPVVVGGLAALCVPSVPYGGGLIRDAELEATQIYRASIQPVSESDDWCGEYAPAKEVLK